MEFNYLDLVFVGVAVTVLIGAFLMMFSDFWTKKNK